MITEEEARYEETIDSLFEVFRPQAIEQFKLERLQSYYDSDPNVALPAINALKEAQSLVKEHPSAALVFASVAIEVGLRQALIWPIVYGLVHSDAAAELIANLVIAHNALDRFKPLLQGILENPKIIEDSSKCNLNTYKRNGASQTLWEEIKFIRKRRNDILHKGDNVSEQEAILAVDVASAFLNDLLRTVIQDLGFTINEQWEIK